MGAAGRRGHTFDKRTPPPGARPGAMVIPEGARPPRIHVIDYSRDAVGESDVTDVASLAPYRTSPTVTWIDVQGIGDESVLRKIGEIFGIHPLALADVVNVPQRPKVEVYGEHILFIARCVSLGERDAVAMEQITFILGPRYLVSFQEFYGDDFDPIRARVRSDAGLMRTLGADYLLYALLDALIDGYYPVLEGIGEAIDDLEEEVVAQPTPRTLERIHRVRRSLLLLRRAIWPQRDAIAALNREENPLVAAPVHVYLRDCADHTVQILDAVETYRELAVGLMEIYLSMVSNRLNEVMKVLTVMSSVFIPLTFVVGIYGMNFRHMPELDWPWAYPILWAVMGAAALGMVVYFRRRGWIGPGAKKNDGGDGGGAR
jgi:magnesium transporter